MGYRQEHKRIKPTSQRKPHENCSEPKEEIEHLHLHFIACIDRFSNYSKTEVFRKGKRLKRSQKLHLLSQ